MALRFLRQCHGPHGQNLLLEATMTTLDTAIPPDRQSEGNHDGAPGEHRRVEEQAEAKSHNPSERETHTTPERHAPFKGSPGADAQRERLYSHRKGDGDHDVDKVVPAEAQRGQKSEDDHRRREPTPAASEPCRIPPNEKRESKLDGRHGATCDVNPRPRLEHEAR